MRVVLERGLAKGQVLVAGEVVLVGPGVSVDRLELALAAAGKKLTRSAIKSLYRPVAELSAVVIVALLATAA